MVLSPGTRLGPYEIVALIGAGGWARSIGRATRDSSAKWPSHDAKLGRNVALIMSESCSRTHDESLDATLKARDKK